MKEKFSLEGIVTIKDCTESPRHLTTIEIKDIKGHVHFPYRFSEQAKECLDGKTCYIEILHGVRDEGTKYELHPRRYSIKLAGEFENKGPIQRIVWDTFDISSPFYTE